MKHVHTIYCLKKNPKKDFVDQFGVSQPNLYQIVKLKFSCLNFEQYLS